MNTRSLIALLVLFIEAVFRCGVLAQTNLSEKHFVSPEDQNSSSAEKKIQSDVHRLEDAMNYWAVREDNGRLESIVRKPTAKKMAFLILHLSPAILYAAERGNLAVLGTLGRNGADGSVGDVTGFTPYMAAAASGNLAAIKILRKAFDYATDAYAIDNTYRTAADYAVLSHRWACLDLIKEYATQADIDHKYPRWEIALQKLRESGAVAQGKENLFSGIALAGGPAMRERLDYAGIVGDVNDVKSLLDAHIDVNARNNDGNTMLQSSVLNATKEKLEYLLSHGADAFLLDHEHFTAADGAVLQKRPDCIRWIADALRQKKCLDVYLSWEEALIPLHADGTAMFS